MDIVNAREQAFYLLDNGLITPEDFCTSIIAFFSNDDIEEFLDANELSSRFFEEDNEDES